MKQILYLLSAGLLLCTACNKNEAPPEEVTGYAPIYQTDPQVESIRSIPPQPIINGGKIYIKDHLLFQAESGKGIHILNIEDPNHPVKLAFLQIAGAQELSVKGNLLYSNNYNDLVVIDISNVQDARLVKRLGEVFHITGSSVPPERGYFECVDPDKGTVVGWEKKTLHSPKCKY